MKPTLEADDKLSQAVDRFDRIQRAKDWPAEEPEGWQSPLRSASMAQLAEAFTPHVLVLGCTAVKSQSGAEAVREYVDISGFLIDLDAQCYFVSAGHTFEYLDQVRAAGFTFTDWHFDDTGAPRQKWNTGYRPLVIDNNDIQIMVDEDGRDYGFLRVSPLVYMNLKANGKRALTSGEWEILPDEEIESFCVVGVPTVLRRVSQSDTATRVDKSCIYLEVLPLPKPPEEVLKPFNRFYARIDVELVESETGTRLSDIRGVSGGPVFAFRQSEDGSIRYWAIAIQSSWYPKLRIIAACPLIPYINWIRENDTS